MLKFKEVLEKRRSIRKYKDTPVPKEKILQILEAARIAPSASHRQPWHFIVVEDKETIKKLAKSEWAAGAPVMIVGLADLEASPGWCINDLGVAFEHLVSGLVYQRSRSSIRTPRTSSYRSRPWDMLDGTIK